jgi:signal transduction histidine kinase
MSGPRRTKAVSRARATANPKTKARAKAKGTLKPRAAARPAAPPPPTGTTEVTASLKFALALGSAAHEIKNGLSPLGMTLQLVERKLLAGEMVPPGDLSFARAQVRRLSRLVNDLLDVTHLDTEQFPVRPQPGNLTATVQEAVEIFQRGNVRQIARALPAHALPARFDAERIVQVLLNLLENAAKYAPLPAPISVTLARVSGGARVEVRDGGPGLPVEDQGHVFERFARSRGAGDGTRGLGLGLYLCRAIVVRHGGRIGVDSAPGQGATFWLELPV